MGGSGGGAAAPAGRLELHDVVKRYFQEPHTDVAGREIDVQEKIISKAEVVGKGQFSNIRLVEVQGMKKYIESKYGNQEDGSPKVSVEVPDYDYVAECHGYFVLKKIKKSEVCRLKREEHIKMESKLHAKLHHPFIARLFHRYQDDGGHLCMLLEFAQGGTLENCVHQNGYRLYNDLARFFAAQLVMVLGDLHSNMIVYRDLNPNNVLLDRKCYIKLVDFGYAKKFTSDRWDSDERTWTLVGTPEYLAPEIIKSKGHNKDVDWWALGVLIHYMLAGYPPWYNDDPHKVYQDVLAKKFEGPAESGGVPAPKHFVPDAKDICKKLLTHSIDRNGAHARIGSQKNGAEDIKKHLWYRGLNWAALYNREMSPPSPPMSEKDEAKEVWMPSLSSASDVGNHAMYPDSEDEAGPILSPEKDAVFANWESLTI